ncbi:MAG: branched-chain amino acid transaminase [Anaerolineales bacterium]|nr:branched-chain amino acid transaminase [Anaerolineales bacterium]MCB9126406.1 branched-chain amino acid transaminase [Ardenticatenales bacterium]MCB9171567.1 branched-chain amino acid transaminase [Ardenticatenales bacterium]
MNDHLKIWANGQLINWNDANVHISTHALHYGSSVFEGIRAYHTPDGPAVLGLQQHTRRLFQSAKIFRMKMPYTEEAINEAILETIAANNLPAAYIRPLAFRGAGPLGVYAKQNPIDVYIMTLEWGRYLGEEALEQGVDVQISSWRRMAPNTHPAMGKIGGNYVNSQLVVMEAKRQGYTEGIALDVNGHVSEGSGENIFVIYDGIVYTPALTNSILSGITRSFVMQLIGDHGYPIKEQPIPREFLYLADEVFFTGTAAEITPIRTIDGLTIGAGKRGPITEALQEDFFNIVEGRTADRHGWLTLVPQPVAVPA